MPEGAPRNPLASSLFGQLSLGACAEWLWSEYPVRYPTLKIALSEGGIGWVAMLLDRLDYITSATSSLVRRDGHNSRFDVDAH